MKLLYKVFFLCTFPFLAMAQQTLLSLEGVSGNENMPIETTAETMEVDQNSGAAVLKGGVTITQGTLKLTANQVTLFTDPETDVFDRMEAVGAVVFSTTNDTASARKAIYIVSKQIIEMFDDVVLTKRNIEVSADKIVMEIETGNAVLSGNVRTVLRSDNTQ